MGRGHDGVFSGRTTWLIMRGWGGRAVKVRTARYYIGEWKGGGREGWRGGGRERKEEGRDGNGTWLTVVVVNSVLHIPRPARHR